MGLKGFLGQALLGLVFVGGHSFGKPAASLDGGGMIEPVPARYSFVPVGFDDNDETQVVIDGYLPNGCYRLTSPDVQINTILKTVKITPLARYFEGPCIEALIPYQLDVNLGVLPEGQYELTLNQNGYRRNANLPPSHHPLISVFEIKKALTSNPDDDLYAPVDHVRVSPASVPGNGVLQATIEGRLTNSCMAWRELKILNHGSTLVLLPLITMMSPPDGECQDIEVSYQKHVLLPTSLNPGRHLLHVRCLNGQALNRLFYANPTVPGH